MVVANPAYGANNPQYLANFTTADYHGTVVWSWQQAMMVQGIEHQLQLCGNATNMAGGGATAGAGATAQEAGAVGGRPGWCDNTQLRDQLRAGLQNLWQVSGL